MSKVITREEFHADPAAATRYARETGPVTIVDSDGKPRLHFGGPRESLEDEDYERGRLAGFESAMRHALHWCREMKKGDWNQDWQDCADAIAEALTQTPPDNAMAAEVPPAVERIRRLEQAVRTMRNFALADIRRHLDFMINEADDVLGETAETRR